MLKIVIIEDETAVRDNLTELLTLEGYEVKAASNGQLGVEIVREFLPDLIICDVMMPRLDGYSVLAILRQHPATAAIPFIFLTAKTTRDDFRQGMSSGADDYITKPFSAAEVLEAIRIRLAKKDILRLQLMQNLVGDFQSTINSLSSNLKLENSSAGKITSNQIVESSPEATPEPDFCQDGLEINFAERLVCLNGQEVKLTRYQYDLLVYMVQNSGRVITHRAALLNVWGTEYEKETQYLHVFVNQLRQKIEPTPAQPRFILTERGVGYRFRKPK